MKSTNRRVAKGPIDHLKKICVEMLGDYAEKPLLMLSATKNTSQELFQTCKEIENFTRLLVDTHKADELARYMREVLRKEVLGRLKGGSS